MVTGLGDQALLAEMARVARDLRASPVPHDQTGARRLFNTYRQQLRADNRTREVRDLVLKAATAKFLATRPQTLGN